MSFPFNKVVTVKWCVAAGT